MRRVDPARMCVACGERDRKSQLVRFFLGEDGSLGLGAGDGRGGYLHPRYRCVQDFIKARSNFVRSLRAVVSRERRAHFIAQIESSAALLS